MHRRRATCTRPSPAPAAQHATLTRQRRFLEALEVLRALESLEWREEEGRRAAAAQENEAQLEVGGAAHRPWRCLRLCSASWAVAVYATAAAALPRGPVREVL